MPLSERENYLRNVSFSGPEWIPYEILIPGATWNYLRGDLEDIVARHPTLFPDFRSGERDYDNHDWGPFRRAGESVADAWGCVWYDLFDGMGGQVVEHPVGDWQQLETYRAPDPMTQGDRQPIDWEKTRRRIERDRSEGRLTSGHIVYQLFQRLTLLRGFENLMLDIATSDERLLRLIEIVQQRNRVLAEQWRRIGVDVMGMGEDLGSQKSSFLSPAQFRKWLAPSYRELMLPFRKAGTHVKMHSDGYVLELVDDLIDCGIDIINLQDLCHGIDNLAREVKGRVAINLDVDRQQIVPFGTRRQIRELIEEEVRKLGSPQGGLDFVVALYPPTPAENIDALFDAFEEFRTYWWEGASRTVHPV